MISVGFSFMIGSLRAQWSFCLGLFWAFIFTIPYLTFYNNISLSNLNLN
jgi:hypothetical protein